MTRQYLRGITASIAEFKNKDFIFVSSGTSLEDYDVFKIENLVEKCTGKMRERVILVKIMSAQSNPSRNE